MQQFITKVFFWKKIEGMNKKSFENSCFRFLSSIIKKEIDIAIIYSRYRAHRLRREVINKKGGKVINKKMKRSIKEYARERFGKKAYWPYLALYTEIRGEFIKGWIPYDYFRYVLLPKMNPDCCTSISEQKTYDHRLFGDFAIRPLFVYVSSILLNAEFEVIKIEDVEKMLEEYNDIIVLKEEKGTQGMQIHFMHSTEFNPEMLVENVNYIIQPYIKQYKPLNDLYPESINTFRVTTYLRRDGSVDVKFVILRFGVDGAKVDNISMGGQYVYFDDNGKPSNYAYDIKGNNWGDRHKNSGCLFSDLKFPMYDDILEKCKNAHLKYPYIRLIGWDVCITESGEPKLVEWNAQNPGFWYLEDILGPIWPNDEDIYN